MTSLDSTESAARTAEPPMKKCSKPYSQNYNEQIKKSEQQTKQNIQKSKIKLIS